LDNSKDDWKRNQLVNWFNVFSVLARTAIHMTSFFLHAAVLHFSTAAHVNFSLIVNLYSLTPFFTAIAFYCFFGEKLSRVHIIGMLFIFSCVYITSMSEPSSPKTTSGDDTQAETEAEYPSVPVVVPVTLAIVSTLCFTTSNTIGRYAISNNKGTMTS
jgi:drug/metabolite transporter (DMT)-like permease